MPTEAAAAAATAVVVTKDFDARVTPAARLPSASCEGWPAQVAAPTAVCSERGCGVPAIASSCEEPAPLCREIACSECQGAEPLCDAGELCAPRMCVLCVSANAEAAIASACVAPPSTAPSELVAATVPPSAEGAIGDKAQLEGRSSWALYEVRDQVLLLVRADTPRRLVPPAPLPVVAPSLPKALPPLRARVGGMGMLALIHAAPANHDDPVASVFRAGASLDDGIRAALLGPASDVEAPREERRAATPAVPLDVVPLLTFERAPSTGAPRRLTPRSHAPVVTQDPQKDRLQAEATLALKRRRGSLARCYAASLQRDPSLAVRIVVDLEVDREGRVTRSSVVSTSASARRLTACVLDTLADVRFRQGQDEDVVITAGFVFRPEQSSATASIPRSQRIRVARRF